MKDESDHEPSDNFQKIHHEKSSALSDLLT